MTIPYEHQKDILAIFSRALDPQNSVAKFPLSHGFTQFSKGLSKFLDVMLSEHFWAQRAMLENDEIGMQILPYFPIILPDGRGAFRVSVYQRKGKGDAKVGEIRLQDLFSIGYGGHPEHCDWKGEDSIFNPGDSIEAGLDREKIEEITVRVKTGLHSHRTAKLTKGFAGFMRDNTPTTEAQALQNKKAVGLVHLALVPLYVAEPNAYVDVVEAEHTICEPMYPQELLDSGRKLEPWSQMLTEWLAKQSLDSLMDCINPTIGGAGHSEPKLFESSIRG